jgi:hypothetical protein
MIVEVRNSDWTTQAIDLSTNCLAGTIFSGMRFVVYF